MAFLSASDHLMVIGWADSQVIGQARGIIHLNPDQGPQLYIDNLGVTPSRQRCGLGTRLVEDCSPGDVSGAVTEPGSPPKMTTSRPSVSMHASGPGARVWSTSSIHSDDVKGATCLSGPTNGPSFVTKGPESGRSLTDH